MEVHFHARQAVYHQAITPSQRHQKPKGHMCIKGVFTLFSPSSKGLRGLCWSSALWEVTVGHKPADGTGRASLVGWCYLSTPQAEGPPIGLPILKHLIRRAFVSSSQSFYWMWFVLESVMELEGSKRTVNLLLGENHFVQWTWNGCQLRLEKI